MICPSVQDFERIEDRMLEEIWRGSDVRGDSEVEGPKCRGRLVEGVECQKIFGRDRTLGERFGGIEF